ncbi:hypothetical protein P171DRAFT_437704 [Karstenula rhodostoma CBS 690.94]|uniref:Uncharacterized protein n=1 Tax=Karstenula rhodostoma CBS 690.94 TaxID=1392251 RepID=A0A9P4P3K5_9PLEO|nr:hypothetical protein P171DRAFT_437704 [Karstenula rhodostoma CBS 690.94]
MSPATLDAADAVMRALRAIDALDPDMASAALPTASFLAHLNIDIADATAQHAHPRRPTLDAVARELRPDKQLALQPPADMAPSASADMCTALEWADRLAEHAYSIGYTVAKHENCTTPATAVTTFGPCIVDPWLAALYEPLWDLSHAWRITYGLKVGDGCSGECDVGKCFGEYCHENVVGCILPVRTRLNADQPMHLGELFCALMLLHRQLKRNCSLGKTVTIAAVTTEGRIRVHEASVHQPTAADAAHTIRITKCVDLHITDVTSQDPVAQDGWLNVMSYLCFTHEANLPSNHPDEPDEQPLQVDVAATQQDNQDITWPEEENIQPAALDMGGKAATKPAAKAATPRKPLAPLNI